MRILLVFFAIFISKSAVSDNVAEIIRKIEQCNTDSCRAEQYINLGDYYEQNNLDSAVICYKKAFIIAKNNKLYKLSAKSLRYIGIISYRKGDFEKAISIISKALTIYKKQNDSTSVSKALNNIGLSYTNMGKYNEALNVYSQALRIDYEKFKKNPNSENKDELSTTFLNLSLVFLHQDKNNEAIKYQLLSLKTKENILENCGNNYPKKDLITNIANCYNNIGIIHYGMFNYSKAEEYYKKALEKYIEVGDKYGISYVYGNFGNLYSDWCKKNNKHNLLDTAINYFNQSIKISEELGDKSNLSSCYNNIGTICMDQNKPEEAINYYKKAIELYDLTKDESGRAIAYWNIADIYLYLADSAALSEQQKKSYLNLSVENAKLAYELGDKMGDLTTMSGAARTLLIVYKKLNKTLDALNYSEYYLNIKDSLFNENQLKIINEISTKYETDKKEKENILLKNEQQLKDTQLKNQFYISLTIGFILIFIIIIALILYKSNERRKKTNLLLKKQNNEIQSKNEEILMQQSEIISQRDTLKTQKEQIESIHNDLMDSISYAERIQHSFILSDEKLKTSFNEYFIFFHPKQIVSGDFYWGELLPNGDFLLVTADCTGHGVPGAIMSILIINSLEKALEKNIYNPAEILNYTRDQIISRLKYDGSDEGGKDGMDATIICFHKNENKITYAAANNPIWIIRNGELLELSYDRMPVGRHVKEIAPFSNKEFSLEKNDIIYTFSDGYSDQFGGEKQKKFMAKRFRELIIAHSALTLERQKEIIETTFNQWKGNLEQTDDVTVIGIKTK